MNFLNVGPLELTVILVLAILLVGPKRLVELFQSIRRFAGQLRSMSSEFTSLIQTEVQSTGRETDSEDEPQDTEREAGGKMVDAIKEGLAPIASLQAELREVAQETRQALESIVTDELEPIASLQAELQAATEETRQALDSAVQDAPAAAADIQDELQAGAQETRQALNSIAESQPGPREGQDEASDREPTS